MRKFGFMVGVAALSLAGCDQIPGMGNDETVTEEAGAEDDVVTQEANREPLVPDDPGITDRLYNGGEPLRLDLQQQHPNRTVVRLTSIQARSTETVVTAEFVNGGDRQVRLNNFENHSYLQTMDGRKFYISPPPTNERLEIPAGQRMQAELVFMGRIPANEQILVLFNDGDDWRSHADSTPGFRFEIPVPGQQAQANTAPGGGSSTMQPAEAVEDENK